MKWKIGMAILDGRKFFKFSEVLASSFRKNTDSVLAGCGVLTTVWLAVTHK